MDRDPGDFVQGPPDDTGGARPGSWQEALPPAPGIRHIDDDDPEHDALIEADIAAGRVYPHALVSRWLRTAGDPAWKPFKDWLAAQDG